MSAPSPVRLRADVALVARGLFESRARARAAIEAGLVLADGVRVGRPSDLVGEAAEFQAEQPFPWVSRGGMKLVAALDAFAIDPAGRRCLDVGASTGGFTDVLLDRGAASVHAVDVGRGQLHPRIGADPRVTSLEGTDIRNLSSARLAPFELVTIDVSFISLRLVLPDLISLMSQGGEVIGLIKPQFEVGRDGVGRGGIVRDNELRERAVADCLGMAADLGLDVIGTMPSPITGGDGNREILFGARHV